jgi:chemotaxis protein CheX
MNNQIEQVDQLTREAVQKVFQGMLSMPVNPEPPSPLAADPAGQILGSVAFIGEATGIIYLFAGVSFARVITSQLLGISEPEVDSGDMVTDAIGELSNMVAGYVKSRLCDGGWRCVLTIPSVVRGQQLSVEASAQTTRRVIGFRNCKYHLLAEIVLKESSEKKI